MTPDVSDWVKRHPLEPVHVDCATTVMLEILDGKCKMSTEEKTVMTLLYDQIKAEPGLEKGLGQPASRTNVRRKRSTGSVEALSRTLIPSWVVDAEIGADLDVARLSLTHGFRPRR